MHFIGTTTTVLTDGATTNPIVVDGEDVTAVAGSVAVYNNGTKEMEFVFNGTKWQEYGSTGSIKALAFKDSASGSVTAEGSNSSSAVSFSGTTDADFITGVKTAAVAPSFTEGTFSAGTLPSFTEGAFTPAFLGTGFYIAGSAPSLGAASTGNFATEGVTVTYTENTETLTLGTASTSSAVTAQGAFNAGSVTTLDLTKFNGGSKASDTFNAGTLPSKTADTFSAGSAATFNTAKAITALGTATAAAQTFTGSAVQVSVS